MEAAEHLITLGGIQAIVEPGPWHYGVDYIAAFFRASEANLGGLLPPPLKVKDRVCIAYVSEFVSVSDRRPEAVHENPENTIYHEAAIGIGCTFNGQPGVFFPVMWVDKEWSLLRGLLNGYSKRLADAIIMTRLHPLNPALKPLDIGSSLSGYCIAGGRRVISLSVKIQKRGKSTDLVSFGSTYGVRRFPSTHGSQADVCEIVEVLKYNSRVDDVWLGEPAIEVPELEELEGFEPLFGAMYKAGFSIRGAKVLRKVTSGTAERP